MAFADLAVVEDGASFVAFGGVPILGAFALEKTFLLKPKHRSAEVQIVIVIDWCQTISWLRELF